MSLITELPTELLVRIFRDVRDIHAQSYSHGWIHITHVCRDWRMIALDAAELWTQIYSVDPDCVQAFLANSKHAPLDIHYTLENSGSNRLDAVVPILLFASSRFRRVELTHLDPAYMFLRHPFPGGAPVLHTLHLNFNALRHYVPEELVSRTPRLCASEHGLPALRRLTLGCWPVENLAAIRGLLNPSLRALSILKPHTRRPARAWADLLTELPLLEELALHSVFPLPGPGPVPTAGQEPMPLVHLPHLAAMRLIGDDPAEQLSLMRSIAASSDVHITFNTEQDLELLSLHETSFEQYTDILCALGQLMRGQHTTLSRPTSLDLCFGIRVITSRATGHGHGVTTIRTTHNLSVTLSAISDDIVSPCARMSSNRDTAPILSLRLQVLDAARHNFPTPLCDMLRSTFSWSTLRQLYLEPTDNLPTTPGQTATAFAAYRDLFLQMTNLRELSINSGYPRDSLAPFGIPETPAVPVDETSGAVQMLFPALEVLTIRLYHRQIVDYGPLCRSMLARKAFGYPLPRVHICPILRRAPMQANPSDLVVELRAAVAPLSAAECSVDTCVDKNQDGNWRIEELASAK